MITSYNQIEKFFNEINRLINKEIRLYVIGGAALLRRELKDGTKDIDLVVNTQAEFKEFHIALEKLEFKTKIPGREYKHMNISQIFQKDEFRIDLFDKKVCSKFSLTDGMIKRAEQTQNLEKLKIFHCSNEDLLLFKTMTERDGDIDDCIKIAMQGIDWKIVLTELQEQIKQSKQDVWITWVGERLDILEEKGLEIPILKEVNILRKKYISGL